MIKEPDKRLGDGRKKPGRKPGQRSPRAATSKGNVALSLKQAQAFGLRLRGFDLAEIGKTLKISAPAAHGLIKRGLAALREANMGDLQGIRELETARLDALLVAIWPYAVPETGVPDDKAVDRVLKIMERRAALWGLDAPKKIAPTNPGGDLPFTPPPPAEEPAKEESLRDLADSVSEILEAVRRRTAGKAAAG